MPRAWVVVEITAAKLNENEKTVSLEIAGFRPVTNLMIKFSLRGADGARIQSEVALTINQLPD